MPDWLNCAVRALFTNTLCSPMPFGTGVFLWALFAVISLSVVACFLVALLLCARGLEDMVKTARRAYDGDSAPAREARATEEGP